MWALRTNADVDLFKAYAHPGRTLQTVNSHRTNQEGAYSPQFGSLSFFIVPRSFPVLTRFHEVSSTSLAAPTPTLFISFGPLCKLQLLQQDF